MEDVILALIAIAAGALFCFRGFIAFRLVIAVWGAFVGFGVGAGLVASFTDEGFLTTGLSWIVGIGVALLFALVAYLFYEVAVILAMGSIGFTLGTTLMVALDVSWTWLIVLVGVVVGGLLAVAAIVADLPVVLLVVLSALAGASAITTGLMLLFGRIETDELGHEEITAQAGGDWWWYAIYAGLAGTGIVLQLRAVVRLRASLREAWAGDAAA